MLCYNRIECFHRSLRRKNINSIIEKKRYDALVKRKDLGSF